MPDSSSTSTTDDTVAASAADSDAERERLIDDLACLVVRQHQRANRINTHSNPLTDSSGDD